MFGIGKNTEDETKENVAEEDGIEKPTIDTSIQTSIIDTDATKLLTEEDSIEKVEEKEEVPPLTWREAKALKRSRYEEKIAHNDKFTKFYTIRNKKTNQVVELRAATPLHACNIIGWRLKKIQVLNVRTIAIAIPAVPPLPASPVLLDNLETSGSSSS